MRGGIREALHRVMWNREEKLYIGHFLWVSLLPLSLKVFVYFFVTGTSELIGFFLYIFFPSSFVRDQGLCVSRTI